MTNSIYETVKTVNGYNIIRMMGTHGCYHVYVKANVFYTFNTIKAAAQFCVAL